MQLHNLLCYARLLLVISLGALIVLILCHLLMRILQRRYASRQTYLNFELLPPLEVSRSPQATQELFTVIHGLHSTQRAWQRLFGFSSPISFEIVSNRASGIRFLLRVDTQVAQLVRQALNAYLPQLQITEIEDSLPTQLVVSEFRQTKHYAVPLAASDKLEQHDPLLYLATAMTNLESEEELRLQLVVTPLPSAGIAGNQGRWAQPMPTSDGLSTSKGQALRNLITSGLLGLVDFGTAALVPTGHHSAHSPAYRHTFPGQQAGAARAVEQSLRESQSRKLQQPLFRASLRVGITTRKPLLRQHRQAITAGLQAFSDPPHQSLRPKCNLPIPFLQAGRQKLFRSRLLALLHRHNLILSATELSSLYHFPSLNTGRPDNLSNLYSRTLAAPVSLKRAESLDVIFGENEHHNSLTEIGLTTQDRERHVYIIGGTGNGKTTLLQYQIVQDMRQGKGVAVIDPHGDMAETLLQYVPEERVHDVVYFNPDDLEYPFGLNLLELTPGLSGHELLREKDLITESVVSVFRKIFSDEDSGGHRIEYILRNAIQTALTIPGSTLFTIYDLLNNPSYRGRIVAGLEDPNLINFWKHELGKAGSMQKVKMAAGITAKIGRFLFSASARQILEQPTSSIDFDDIIDSGKILICNFSKGLLGEDTSELFGIMVLAKLQLTCLRRARLPQTQRRPFYLYVDEFQNFATPSFVQMLSEARKYKLFLIMAEQSTAQQKDQQMVQIILANVGTVICFRTGNAADAQLLLPLFEPFVTAREIISLSPYSFYCRIVTTLTQEPLSGRTIVLPSTPLDMSAAVKASSRARYARQVLPEAHTKAPVRETVVEIIDK